MTLKSTTALLCAGIALAGCGSSGGGSVTSANSIGSIYPSNFRDGTNEYDALEDGLVYYIGSPDTGKVNEFHVTIDRDSTPNRLIVRQNGGAAVVYTPLSVSDTGSELRTVWVHQENTFNERQFQVIVNKNAEPSDSAGIFRINYPAESIGPQNFGRGGLETRIQDLPTTSATYSGAFLTDTTIFEPDTNGAPGQLRAVGVQAIDTSTSNTVVNFATGNIRGDHSGSSFLGTTELGVSGRVVGSVDGSRVAGTLSITGGATGSLDFGGMFTGPSANNLVGGVGGTVMQDGESHNVGGEFRLGQTSAN